MYRSILGKDQVMWHYRDAKEFFDSTINDPDTMSDSFLGMFDFDETGLMRKTVELYRAIPVPANFKDVYKAAPIFDLLFPKTKVGMNMLALMEDIYMLSYNSHKDYSLFKSLKTYINQSRAKLKQQQKMLNEMNKGISGHPSHLNFDEMVEQYAPKSKTSDNHAYQKITDTYIKLDLRGHKSDDRFSNLIDDSLHVFYGAHCNYFITLDDKCHYKAAETYHKLGLVTKALKPQEFVDNLTCFIDSP
jgi:hypothetical protein